MGTRAPIERVTPPALSGCAETRAVAQVQLHGKSDWRALSWWLGSAQ
jgi:hypothetical protein